MINAEKYRDKLLKFIEEKNAGSFTFSKGKEGKFWQCGGRCCSECGMSKERSNCSVERLKWLLSEYKEHIKLTRTEYLLLRHVYELNYKYIARDKNGDISLYLDEPNKYLLTEIWHGKEYKFTLFNGLFKFVKWEDSTPTSIKEVLDNCEVVEK
jgi:hypothetical protein